MCRHVTSYAYIINLFFMQAPEIDKCSMLAIKHYDVIIYSEEGEIIESKETGINSVTLPMEHLNDNSNTAFTVNVTVTVVDIEGQRSTTSTVTVIIDGTQNANSSKYVSSLKYINKKVKFKALIIHIML